MRMYFYTFPYIIKVKKSLGINQYESIRILAFSNNSFINDLLGMECPFNKTQWKQRSLEFSCQNVDVYHCLLLEDKTDVKEVCLERSLLNESKSDFQISKITE